MSNEAKTIKVCNTCGQRVYGFNQRGEITCLVCLGKTFREVKLPDKLTCIHCKKEYPIEEVLKLWKFPPFFDSTNNTFYDGCRGWN